MKRLTQRIKAAAQSPLVRNFGVLLSGTAVAQVLPLLTAPILARLYTPAQFGEYALFVSGVNVLSQLVCMKYDFAILTAKTDGEAAALFRLSLRLSVVLSLALAALFPLAGSISTALGGQDIGWVLLLPAGSLVMGLYSALTYYSTRLLRYKAITKATICKSGVLVAVQIGLFYAGLGALALTLGQVAAYAAGCLLLWGCIRREAGKGTPTPLRTVAKTYSAFPKFTLPGALCNTAAANSASFFLSAFYSAQELGYYSLVNRVLAAPLALIATTAGQVYTKELTDAHRQGKGTRAVFRRVGWALTAVSLPAFVLLFVFAEPFVRLVFGPQWVECAVTLRILIPLVAVRFVTAPLSTTGIVLGRQMPTMVWQVSLLVAALLPAAVYAGFGLAITRYLTLQTALQAICYLVFLWYCARLTGKGGFVDVEGP